VRPGTAGERLDEAAVRAVLPGFFGPVEVAASLPSTMLRAGELAAAGAGEGAIVLADEQTAGRGRLGRTWTTPPGTALMLSLVLRPTLPPERTWTVLAAAGVALADAVATLLGADPSDRAAVALKWPNDLLVEGRKAAGLLAERGTAASSDAHDSGARDRDAQAPTARPDAGGVVLGMGVNVTQRLEDFPGELRDRATSLAVAARAGAAAPTRLRLLQAWSGEFVRRYAALGADGNGILPAYRRRLGTLGQDVRVDRLAGPALRGRAVDVEPDGSLVVQLPDGARVEVASGDVEHLRPVHPSARHPSPPLG
jgi:BirA family biotin operon repressor/biotin-[acetyl-CoA-carboxylase] ligase